MLEGLELLLAASLAAGLPDEAEDLRWALAREAARTARPRSQWAASLVAAALALARGEDEEGDRAAEEALNLGLELGIADATGAYGVHAVAAGMLRGDLSGIAPLIDQAVEMYPRVAAWPAAAALARAQALDPSVDADADPRREEVDALLGRFVERRRSQVILAFDRPGLCLAAAAAWGLGDHPRASEVAEIVLDGLPSDPDTLVVVGVGAATLGPVELYRGLALSTLGRTSDAVTALDAAATLADRLGWVPWAATADALASAVSPTGDGWAGPRSPPPKTGSRPIPHPFGLACGPRSRGQGGSSER